MAPLVGPHDERYEDFYSNWTKIQELMLKDLEKAVHSDMREPELLQEVKKVAEHLEAYYNAKKDACHQDILQIVTPNWRSPLEKAFLWLGGWRPSLAFQLVYALAGQQIEAELVEFLQGVDTPSFASLSSSQLSQISELQTSTNRQEEFLSNEMAMLQQSFVDEPLLSLVQAYCMVQVEEASSGIKTSTSKEDESPQEEEGGDDHGAWKEGECALEEEGCDKEEGGDVHIEPRSGEKGSGSSGHDSSVAKGDCERDDDGLDAAMQGKLSSLQRIANQADALRLGTLKKVLDLLDTYQKAQYLIVSGKLQVALRDIGERLNGTGSS